MMAALSRRDIEMIFRAETDGATRNIKDLTNGVAALRKQLQDQVAATERGDGSLEDLAKTTRDLKKAQDELGTARSLLTSLNSTVSAADRAQAKVEKLTAEMVDLQKAYDSTDAPTKRLTNSIAAKAKALDAAREKATQEALAVAEVRTQVEAIIGPVDSFEASFKNIANAGKDIARGLAIASEATETFGSKMTAAAAANMAAEKELSSGVAFEQAGRQAGLLQSQIDYLAQFENRIELLAKAKAELGSQNANFDRALSAQEAKVGSQNVQTLRDQITATFAEEERLAQLNAFQQIATQARASVADVARFQSAFDPAIMARFGTAIEEIQNPAAAAIRSLDGIAGAVSNAESVLNGKYKPTVSAAAAASNELAAAQANLNRIASQVDGYRDQEAAVTKAQGAFDNARRDVLALADQIEAAVAPSEQLAKAMQQAQLVAEQTGTALQHELTALDQLGAKAAKAGIDVGALAVAEERITATAGRAAAAQAKLGSVSGANGGKGFLGLNPFELQNLSFQINDVFTSLASGISPMQTLAQQGGQVFQIFQGRIAAIFPILLKFLPLIGAAATAFLVFSRAADQASQAREFQGTLDALGDAGGNTAAGMLAASNALVDFGAKSADAEKAVKSFVENGLNPDSLLDFAAAAKNLSDVTGTALPDAADKVSKAFTGNRDDILKLDDQFHFLTDAERDHIGAMDESTQASEIRTVAFQAFFDKMSKGAQDMEGPWSGAVRALESAWHGLLDAFGATTILEKTSTFLANSVKGFAVLANILVGIKQHITDLKDQRGLGQIINDAMTKTQNDIDSRFRQGQPGADPGANQPKSTTGGQDALRTAKLQEKLATASIDLSKQKNRQLAEQATRELAVNQALNSHYSATEAQQLADLAVDKLRDGYAKKDEARDKAAAKRKAAAAATLAREYAEQQNTLDNSLSRMNAAALKAEGGTIEDQVAASRKAVAEQYSGLLNQLASFRTKFGAAATIHGMTQTQYKAQIQANEQILSDQAEMQTREKGINDLLSQRSTQIKDIESQVESGAIDPSTGFQKIEEVTSKVNTDLLEMIKNARAFVATLAPSPETAAMLAKLDQAASQAGSGASNKANSDAANVLIGQQESKLNSIISERNDLIAANNELVKLGGLSQTDAQKAAQTAYAQTQPLIDAQIASMQQLLAATKGTMDPALYEAWQAKLKLVGQEAQYTNANYVQLKNSIEGAITQNAMTLVDQMAKSLAKVATGAESVGQGFMEIARAFVSFIASTLIQIGKLIIEALILKAVDTATGGMITALLSLSSTTSKTGTAGGGGILGIFSGLFGKKHNGGTVGSYSGGQQTTTRTPTLAQLSAGIPRYHGGTQGVGLARDEQMTILQKGEKVVTEEQDRRATAANNNAPKGARSLRQVLAFGDDQVASAMQGRAGEDVTLTHIRRNAPMVKQILGS